VTSLTPWALGPLETLLHAETHYRNGEDLDRRIAIVGFDNAIELAIHTYLSLHPIQREGRTYPRNDVERWLENFHTKIEFFELEVAARGLDVICDNAKFIWYHDVRNGQYHAGGATIPQGRELGGIREAALWVFSVLFAVEDVETVLAQLLVSRTGADVPRRNDDDDRLLDAEYGTIDLAGRPYYLSEVLYSFDPVLYSETANDLRRRDAEDEAMGDGASE
jgi:hypothetical protein